MTLPSITWPYRLTAGHSDDPAKGACAMDAVNWLVHGEHGDEPKCACPVIGAFVMRGNDAMPSDVRQGLLAYLHRIAGSRSKDHRTLRARILVLAAVRVFLPAWMCTVALDRRAERLLAIPDNAKWKDVRSALPQGLLRRDRREIGLSLGWLALNGAEMVDVAVNKANAGAIVTAAGCAGASIGAFKCWPAYFAALDAALNAGPQGEPWSADVAAEGLRRYTAAGGKGKPVLLEA